MKEAILTTKKKNQKSRKSLKTVANGKKNETKDIEQTTENRTESEEDAVEVIDKFEEILVTTKGT